jgi:hypothetical protein
MCVVIFSLFAAHNQENLLRQINVENRQERSKLRPYDTHCDFSRAIYRPGDTNSSVSPESRGV